MQIGDSVYNPTDSLFDRSLGAKEEVKNYDMLFFTKHPKWYQDNDSSRLFHMLEKMFKEIKFPYAESEVLNSTGSGFAGRVFSTIPSMDKCRETILEATYYELTHEPIQTGIETWMDAIASHGTRVEYRKEHHGWISGTFDRVGRDQKHPIITQLHIEHAPCDQFAELIWAQVNPKMELEKAVMLLGVKPIIIQDVTLNDPGMSNVMRKIVLVGEPKRSVLVNTKAAELLKGLLTQTPPLDFSSKEGSAIDMKTMMNYSPLTRMIMRKPDPINSLNFNPDLGRQETPESP